MNLRIEREIKENLENLIRDNMKDCVTDVIESYIDDQPYDCKCDNCGKGVYWTRKIDNDGDIYLTITPCTCLLEEYKSENTKE